MEPEGSLFETSEMAANFLASTSLLIDAWSLCTHANSPTSVGFVVNQKGSVGYVSFSGLQDFGPGFGSCFKDTVPLQGGEVDGLFAGLGRHGDDHEEPVMVHASLLQLFLRTYAIPSFQTQMKALVETSKSIVITGHSLGGAIASLTALWLLLQHQTSASPPQVLCITFGSPLLGNKSLSRSLLRQRWAGNFCHVVLKHDIVPRILFAPLESINSQLHFLLQYIQTSITSQFGQVAVQMSEEMKVQLFTFVLAYTEAMADRSTDCSETPGLLWPFGSYLFCTEEGAVCVDNSVSVVKLLHLLFSIGNPNSCFEDHMKYGVCVEKVSFQFLMNKGFMQGEVPSSSYEAGLALALESSELTSPESVSVQARDCLKMAKQIGLTPNLHCAKLAINLAKITPHRAQIEWYKSCCDQSENQMGYYDSFKKRQASKRDNQVNMFRIKLGSFWDNVIYKIDCNELPHDFHRGRKWVNAAHFYQLLVEPLDIAEYYRSGEHLRKGHYLRNGRERRHEIFAKWWRERNMMEKESKRSKFASLTQDSCFWARVEEAKDLLQRVRTEKKASNMAQLWQDIDDFERYATQLIQSKQVSSDVLYKNSSYSLWIEEVRELRSQVKPFHQLAAGFLDGEMVP